MRKFRIWLSRKIMPAGQMILTSPYNHSSIRREVNEEQWRECLNGNTKTKYMICKGCGLSQEGHLAILEGGNV